MIDRSHHLNRLKDLLNSNPVVAIQGARQVGKTTLANQFLRDYTRTRHTFDLEKPSDLARLADPELVLSPLAGLIVIDECQRMKGLFPLIRVLVDRRPERSQFLLLGSVAPDLRWQGNESLAGRIAYHTLSGFTMSEVGDEQNSQLWLRGGFPRSFLAKSDVLSWEWRQEFIDTFLERDIPQLGIRIGASTMRRFWTMLAHSHGQIWNASQFGRNFGVNHTTIRHYLDILQDSLVIRILHPWHANTKKRQVKAPKVYFRDVGLLHALLGIVSLTDLESHPTVGTSWESFAMQEVVERLGVRSHECFFWATHAGAELDLLVARGSRHVGFEFKLTSTPTVTKSMQIALNDLNLERLYVIHPGQECFDLARNIRAVSLLKVEQELEPW